MTRKKKLANALMPYWVITCMSKAEFCARYGLSGDECEMGTEGLPVSRVSASVLDGIGTRIGPGETVSIELSESDSSLFVSTIDGYLSNEVLLESYWSTGCKITLTTEGGFKTLPHPVVEGL